MKHQRIGEILKQTVPLSAHDVEEVLNEQKVTHQRFGDAALALGLCAPEQLWKAWVDQLTQHTQVIDLEKCGVDSQAVALVPDCLAHQHRVLAVRASTNEIVIATDTAVVDEARVALENVTGKRVIFVTTTTAGMNVGLAYYHPNCKCEAA